MDRKQSLRVCAWVGGVRGRGREGGFRRGAGVTHQLGCSPGLNNFCSGPVRDGGTGRENGGELSILVPSLNYHNKFGNFVLFIYQGQNNKGSCWSLFWRHRDKAPDRSGHVWGDEQTPLRGHLIILSQYLEAKIIWRKTIADANEKPVDDEANGGGGRWGCEETERERATCQSSLIP